MWGAILALIAAILSNLGMTIQARWRTRSDAYWVGLSLIATAQVLDFLALADVSPVLIGAFLALGLATLPFWRWVLDRRSRPTRGELLGIAIIILADTLVVLSSSDQALDLESLLTLLAATPSVVYACVSWIVLVVLFTRATKPHVHPLESAMLPALLGAQLFLGSKVLSGCLFHSASDAVQHPLFWLVFVLVLLLVWFQQRTYRSMLQNGSAGILPVFQCFWMLHVALMSFVALQEYAMLPWRDSLRIWIGMALLLVGVGLLQQTADVAATSTAAEVEGEGVELQVVTSTSPSSSFSPSSSCFSDAA
jgi:hypothetical protein